VLASLTVVPDSLKDSGHLLANVFGLDVVGRCRVQLSLYGTQP
jgi:hypothetical protein